MTNIEFNTEDIIQMISDFQDEQTVKANKQFDFTEFIDKPVSSLRKVQDSFKISSKLWPDRNRIVNVTILGDYVPIANPEVKTLNNLKELIEEYPLYIIKDIKAYGIFALEITLKRNRYVYENF